MEDCDDLDDGGKQSSESCQVDVSKMVVVSLQYMRAVLKSNYSIELKIMYHNSKIVQ